MEKVIINNADKQRNQHLLYEINMYRRKLDFEIVTAEQQLASVKRRLANLTQDLFIYLAFIIVPILLYYGFSICSLLFFSPIIYIIFEVAKFLTTCIFIIMLPSSIYNLTKTIILLWINRESNETTELPPLEGTYKGGSAPKEVSYRLERDKLLLVLSRYYLNREKLDKLYQQVNSASNNMTRLELEYELKQLPFYEGIQPANSSSGPMGEQVKRKTKVVMIAIVSAILLSVLIAVLA